MSRLELFLRELKLTPKQMENFSHRNNNVNFSLSLSPSTSTSGEGMQVEEDYKDWNPENSTYDYIFENIEKIHEKHKKPTRKNIDGLKYKWERGEYDTVKIKYDELLKSIYTDYQTKFPKKAKVRKFVEEQQGEKQGKQQGRKEEKMVEEKEEKQQENKEDIGMQDDEKDNTNMEVKSLRTRIKGYLDLEGLTPAEIEEILEEVDTDYEDYRGRKPYDDEEGKEEAFHEVVETVRDKANYLTNRYSDKQLEKTFENMLSSMGTINKEGEFNPKIDQCDYKTILNYLCFIKEYPQFALPTLLWLDTFHDFKEERLMASVELEEGSKRKKVKLELNKIIDYICYRIYDDKHWAGLNPYTYKDTKNNIKTDFETVKDCINIGHTYNFDKMYQNSFFEFAINDTIHAFQYYGTYKNDCANNPNNCRVKVIGFHKDAKHTVLRPLVVDDSGNFVDRPDIAKLLYDVSNVFIANADGWESDFLYMYMLYNFEFNIGGNTRDKFLDDLRQISRESITRRDIPYYAKDVDKASSHYLKGDLVVLPASIFDANPSNSSKNKEAFVPIPSTIIPHCNGYNFIYTFGKDNCKLTLKYGNGTDVYTVCDRGNNNSLSEPICGTTSRVALNEVNSSIKELSKLINSIDIYFNDNEGYIQNEFNTLKERINTVYFGDDNCVKLPDKQGMSPVDIISVVIGLLLRDFTPATKKRKSQDIPAKVATFKKHNGDHPLSPISCKVLDFWVALKRIGDFGQILQCKQLGIPLFTNDNMQILISMAACSSVVFTIDNSKAIWYDGFEDAFMKNNLAKEYECYREDEDECTIKRIEKDEVKERLDKLDKIEGTLMNERLNVNTDFNVNERGIELLSRQDELKVEPPNIQLQLQEKDKKILNKRREEIKDFIQEQKNIITYKGVINSSFKNESFKDIYRDCKSSSENLCETPSKNLKKEKTYSVPNIRDNCVLSISSSSSSSSLSNWYSSSSLNTFQPLNQKKMEERKRN